MIVRAIQKINPDANFTINADDLDQITWLNGTVEISKAEIEAEIILQQAEYDAQAYARNRKAEYPDTGTQFNKIYDDGLTKWKAEMVDPVKTKWPKDNSGPVE